MYPVTIDGPSHSERDPWFLCESLQQDFALSNPWFQKEMRRPSNPWAQCVYLYSLVWCSKFSMQVVIHDVEPYVIYRSKLCSNKWGVISPWRTHRTRPLCFIRWAPRRRWSIGLLGIVKRTIVAVNAAAGVEWGYRATKHERHLVVYEIVIDRSELGTCFTGAIDRDALYFIRDPWSCDKSMTSDRSEHKEILFLEAAKDLSVDIWWSTK